MSRIENAFLRVDNVNRIISIEELYSGTSSIYKAEVEMENSNKKTMFLKMNAYGSVSPRQFTSEIDILKFIEGHLPTPEVLGNGIIYDNPYIITEGYVPDEENKMSAFEMGKECGSVAYEISHIGLPETDMFGRIIEINSQEVSLDEDTYHWDSFLRRYCDKKFGFIKNRNNKYFDISTVQELVDDIYEESMGIDKEPEKKLIHGDFREGNIIWGEYSIRCVLDWERSFIGHDIFLLVSTREFYTKGKSSEWSESFTQGLYDGWGGDLPTEEEERLYSKIKYLDEICGFPIWWDDDQKEKRKEEIKETLGVDS